MTTPRVSTLRRARIEIIPLIDVIFFLLATFVLFTLSLNRMAGIELTLPRTTLEGDQRAAPVVISLSAAESLYWDGVPFAPTELPGRLLLLRERDPSARVLIAGDEHASYAAAIRVLDAVRGAGIDSVSVETRVRPRDR